jgi:four helix bundle protein
MEDNNWVNYKIEVREKLRKFSLKIIRLSEMLDKGTAGKVINYQLTKSGTSTYANYRAALRGRSKAEFYSKLSITVEEADETELWLDLLISSEIINDAITLELHVESLEIVKILASMRKRLGN